MHPLRINVIFRRTLDGQLHSAPIENSRHIVSELSREGVKVYGFQASAGVARHHIAEMSGIATHTPKLIFKLGERGIERLGRYRRVTLDGLNAQFHGLRKGREIVREFGDRKAHTRQDSEEVEFLQEVVTLPNNLGRGPRRLLDARNGKSELFALFGR
jgi:hypothetical protein